MQSSETQFLDSGDRELRLRIAGVVQGVGFRPHVYRLAREYGLGGWVLNDGEGVLVHVEGSSERVGEFHAAVASNQPVLASIESVRVLSDCPLGRERLGSFEIRESQSSGERRTLVPPDTNVCADCCEELRDPSNRRYRYPFINCTNCGPRYSLIRHLPYDRRETTMAEFTMCPACQREYDNPHDRRFHAQPNACAECGPVLSLSEPTGCHFRRGESALNAAVEALKAGQIVAVKSVGGFHLAVNARDADAVARLRRRKHRDAKPFAVMAANLDIVQAYVECDDSEVELLCAPARPIVLLRKRIGTDLPESIAPDNPSLGVMLASAPLHYLLQQDPALSLLVMTSGNAAGYPIAYRNDAALDQLFDVADVILHHDRGIETRVDDTVLRVSRHEAIPQPLTSFLRRSRGYAPYAVRVPKGVHDIVALGAELKTTVAISHGDQVYLSQHIGDLKNDETFESHQSCIEHLQQLYNLRPEWLACDMHPAFRSTRLAREMAPGKVIPVQHHHAHMAACMTEHGLEGQTIGVVFDGAGYGLDGTVWGGEFLLGDCAQVRRVAHLRSLALLGGDKAVKEPWRLAFALVERALDGQDAQPLRVPRLDGLDAQQRHVLRTMLRRGIGIMPSTSMGRLFDGVAALLGVCTDAEYEAHGPIALESLLQRQFELLPAYSYRLADHGDAFQIDPDPMIRELLTNVAAGADVAHLSRRFHSTVVEMVRSVCLRLRHRHRVSQVVLSGGVFLNEFLLVNTIASLEAEGFKVYAHQSVPCNDGGIALGQIAVANAVIDGMS